MWTLDDIKKSAVAHINPQLVTIQNKKRTKYGARKKEVDGILFASEREAKRYQVLKLMQKQGLIGLLELQVPFELNPGGSHSLKYIADFKYIDACTGETIIEDCKGFRTSTYLKKRRLMWKLFKIKIKET